MSTYVRLVDQTIRYTTPRIIPSFHKKNEKKRYSDRAVRPCSFLLDVIFNTSVFFTLHKVACLLSACAKDLIRVKLKFQMKKPFLY